MQELMDLYNKPSNYYDKKHWKKVTNQLVLFFNSLIRSETLIYHIRRKDSIEPVIGHLKSDHRMNRNFYKGITGDVINVMLSSAAFNFKRMMRK